MAWRAQRADQWSTAAIIPAKPEDARTSRIGAGRSWTCEGCQKLDLACPAYGK